MQIDIHPVKLTTMFVYSLLSSFDNFKCAIELATNCLRQTLCILKSSRKTKREKVRLIVIVLRQCLQINTRAKNIVANTTQR